MKISDPFMEKIFTGILFIIFAPLVLIGLVGRYIDIGDGWAQIVAHAKTLLTFIQHPELGPVLEKIQIALIFVLIWIAFGLYVFITNVIANASGKLVKKNKEK